jgi:hypothetical protein
MLHVEIVGWTAIEFNIKITDGTLLPHTLFICKHKKNLTMWLYSDYMLQYLDM